MTRKILFVEDDKVDHVAIQRALDAEGFSHDSDIAHSVKEAQQLLRVRSYDAAVVDFNLGDGTCFDVFDFLDGTPFIIVTGQGSEEIAVEAIKCGAADYLVKDPDRRYLRLLPNVIERVIESE